MYYNLAPNIFRKRLIIEGRYQKTIHSLDFLYNFLLSATSLITDADGMKK